MGLRVKSAGDRDRASDAPDDGQEEETQEEFEERVYTALMKVARGSSAKLRSALGSCVLMGTRYAQAPDMVREAIAEFIDEADL